MIGSSALAFLRLRRAGAQDVVGVHDPVTYRDLLPGLDPETGRDVRVGREHVNSGFLPGRLALTMKQCVQTDLEADRQVADTLAELIIGRALASTGITANVGEKAPNEGSGDTGKAA
jgi:hypothetical protein